MKGRSVLRLTLLCLLPLVVLVGLAAAHLAVNSQRDDVAVTETVLAGDPAAAAGVTLTDWWNWSGDIAWETRYGPARETETDFTFLPDMPRDGRQTNFRLAGSSFNRGMSGSNLLSDLEEESQPGRVSDSAPVEWLAWELAQEMGPGETVKKTISLAEKFPLIPLYADLEVMDGPWIPVYLRGNESNFITEFFSIPMPEDAAVELSVTTDTEGKVVEINCTEQTPLPMVSSMSITFPEGEYVLFAVREDAETPVDLSHVKEGKGLYCLQYGEVTQSGEGYTIQNTVFTEIHTVYPFQEGERFLTLHQTPQQDLVLLVTEAEGELFLTVLSPDGTEELQRISLGTAENVREAALYPYEDWLGIYLSDGRLAVLSREGDGYVLDLAVNLKETRGFPEIQSWKLTLDYDGQRLAAAVLAEEERQEVDGVYLPPEPLTALQVFDSSGQLLYAGCYQNGSTIRYSQSLYTSWGDEVSQPVEPVPLSVELKK